MNPHILLMDRLEQATARVEKTVYIAAAIGGDFGGISDELVDLFEEDEGTMRSCFGDDIPGDLLAASGQHVAEAFGEWLSDTGRLGWLVQVATPVMTPRAGGTASFSWSRFCTHWVYAETFELALEGALSWVEERRAKERQKAGLV